MQKSLAVAGFAAFLALGARAAHGSHTEPFFLAIQYKLGGISQTLTPAAFTTPVYQPSSPAPGNIQQPTGSFVTFRFNPGGLGPTNFFSGTVQMWSMVISGGAAIPGLVTGYQRLELNGPLDGGYLTNPVTGNQLAPPPGRIAGTGIGVGTSNGFVHCTASPGACYAQLEIAPSHQSMQLGLGANDPATGGTLYWSAHNPGLTGVPVPWAGGGPAAVPGFWSITEQGGLLGTRPFCTATGTGTSAGLCTGSTGTVVLVGLEIARWQNVPEPAVSPLLLLVLAGTGGLSLWLRRV